VFFSIGILIDKKLIYLFVLQYYLCLWQYLEDILEKNIQIEIDDNHY
tara:strand:- start:2334 stop:2474 length:141 start_codon:yes stop_codon:yes gene_type:complete